MCRPPGACTVYQSQRHRLVLSALTPAELVMVPPGVFTLVEKSLTVCMFVYFCFWRCEFSFYLRVLVIRI